MRVLHAFNGSDGAIIPGAIPRVPEAIEPGPEILDREGVKVALKRAFDLIQPSAIFTETDLSVVAKNAEKLFADLDAMLAKFDNGKADFAGVYRATRSFLEKADATYSNTETIICGTLIAMPRIAMFFGFRVDDVTIRNDMFSMFLKEFRATLEAMKEGTAKLFIELQAAVEPILHSEPEDLRRRA
jgi:hypothetical protein